MPFFMRALWLRGNIYITCELHIDASWLTTPPKSLLCSSNCPSGKETSFFSVRWAQHLHRVGNWDWQKLFKISACWELVARCEMGRYHWYPSCLEYGERVCGEEFTQFCESSPGEQPQTHPGRAVSGHCWSASPPHRPPWHTCGMSRLHRGHLSGAEAWWQTQETVRRTKKAHFPGGVLQEGSNKIILLSVPPPAPPAPSALFCLLKYCIWTSGPIWFWTR